MRQSRHVPGWIGPLVAFLFLGCLAAAVSFGMREQAPSDKAVANIQKAIAKAAVCCYALEGAYPPDLQYLKDNYNIIIDEKRYYCEIEPFGSNVRPGIIVVPLGGMP